jgi:hypothetical protein
MSHRQKLEQILDLLINEEHEAASEILHSVIVEKARTMYEELVDEDFGGDEKEDFADEIEADKDEVEDAEDGSDDFEDEGEEEAEESDDDGEDELEDRLEDVEDTLAQLQAEFDRLVGGDDEFDAEGDDDFAVDDEFAADDEFAGDDFGADFEEEGYDDLEEATKLQDAVPAVPNQEGRFAGTGKNSKAGATGKESMFTKAPRKADHGGKEHPIGKGGDESGMKAGKPKDHTPSDNVDAPQKKQGPGEGKFAGTGKHSKAGAENVQSTLGSKGNPTGV